MGLFNNKKIETMQSNIDSLSHDNKSMGNFIKKTATDWSAWRNGNTSVSSKTSYTKIVSEYSSIGDPYLNNVIVRKAINKVADNIAQVPFVITNMKDVPVADNDKYVKLFNYVNDLDDSYDFIYDIVVNMQRFGKAFIKFSKEELGGVPISMQSLPANFIKAKVAKDGTLKHWLWDEKTIFEPEEILFMRYRHPTKPYDGLSPLSSAVVPILQQFYSEAYNINFFKNGGHPKGFWSRDNGGPLNSQQTAELDNVLNQKFEGVDNAHKQVSVPRGVKYNVISTNQKDMEFNLLLERTRDDILFALDVPKAIMGFTDTTFNNMSEAKKALWTQSCMPIMRRLEMMFDTNFFYKRKTGYHIVFNTEGIPELQEDNKVKGETAKIYYEMGVPFSVLNERFGLEFQEFDGWSDKPNQAAPNPFQLSVAVPETKQIGVKKSEFAIQIEYKMILSDMLKREKSLYNKTKGAYADIYKEVIKFVKDEEEKKAVTDDDFIARYVAYLEGLEVGKDFRDKVLPLVGDTFNAAAKSIYSEVGVAFDIVPQRAIDHLVRRGLLLQESPDNIVQSIIDHMESDNFSIDSLAKDISSKYDQLSLASAKMIAVTETTAAYATGREDAMKELNIKSKRWVNSNDNKVRHSHRDSATGKTALVGEPFANGLMRPGDGGAGETINCRCVLTADI